MAYFGAAFFSEQIKGIIERLKEQIREQQGDADVANLQAEINKLNRLEGIVTAIDRGNEVANTLASLQDVFNQLQTVASRLKESEQTFHFYLPTQQAQLPLGLSDSTVAVISPVPVKPDTFSQLLLCFNSAQPRLPSSPLQLAADEDGTPLERLPNTSQTVPVAGFRANLASFCQKAAVSNPGSSAIVSGPFESSDPPKAITNNAFMPPSTSISPGNYVTAVRLWQVGFQPQIKSLGLGVTGYVYPGFLRCELFPNSRIQVDGRVATGFVLKQAGCSGLVITAKGLELLVSGRFVCCTEDGISARISAQVLGPHMVTQVVYPVQISFMGVTMNLSAAAIASVWGLGGQASLQLGSNGFSGSICAVGGFGGKISIVVNSRFREFREECHEEVRNFLEKDNPYTRSIKDVEKKLKEAEQDKNTVMGGHYYRFLQDLRDKLISQAAAIAISGRLLPSIEFK